MRASFGGPLNCRVAPATRLRQRLEKEKKPRPVTGRKAVVASPGPSENPYGGSGRLRDPRVAIGEHVEVIVVPLTGRARSRGVLGDQLLGHVSRKLTRSSRQRGRAWEPATTAAAAKAAANNS